MQMIRINMIIARDWESLRQRYIASHNVGPGGTNRVRRSREARACLPLDGVAVQNILLEHQCYLYSE